MGQSPGPNHVPLWTESVLCFPASALVTQQQPSHLLPSPPQARLLLPSHVLTLQLEVFLNMISEKYFGKSATDLCQFLSHENQTLKTVSGHLFWACYPHSTTTTLTPSRWRLQLAAGRRGGGVSPVQAPSWSPSRLPPTASPLVRPSLYVYYMCTNLPHKGYLSSYHETDTC